MIVATTNLDIGASRTSRGPSDVLDLATRRLQWLDARQSVLATNVANSDTPGYRPKDVASFADHLSQIGAPVDRTNAAHFAIDTSSRDGTLTTVDHERAPDGNAVSLQQQLTEIAGNDSEQRIASSLYSRVMQMYSTALDR